jgi:hypothetical protein
VPNNELGVLEVPRDKEVAATALRKAAADPDRQSGDDLMQLVEVWEMCGAVLTTKHLTQLLWDGRGDLVTDVREDEDEDGPVQ